MPLDTSLHKPEMDQNVETESMGHRFDETELRGLVAEASTIEERLGPRFEAVEGSAPDEQRLARWCQKAAQGDEAVFRKRLRWSGWTLEQARDAVRPARLRSQAELPDWTTTLNQCVEAITDADVESARFCDEDAPLPFEHLLSPVVVLAQRRVSQAFDQEHLHITDHALADLERLLLRQLTSLAEQALNIDFSVFRTTSSVGASSGDQENIAYHAFLRHLRQGEIRPFFQRYSVLARKLSTCVDDWVTNTVRFLTRLHNDWPALRHTFSPNSDPGRVCRIKSGVSDPHCNRQQAHVVACENGLQFVYKPKSLGLAVAFQRLVDWCNDHGMTPALYSLDIIGRPDYGWVEFVCPESCSDAQGATSYFQRAGGLLALAYVLNGKDLHHQNLIAQGEHPILIDLETILVPSVINPEMNESNDIEPGGTDSNEEAAAGLSGASNRISLEDSVLGTLLLPRFFAVSGASSDPVVRNISGLGGETKQTVVSSRHWTNVNTDQMQMTRLRTEIELSDNVPRLEGEALHSSDYVEEIQDGFDQMYRIIQTHRDEWTRDGGVLSWFSGADVRFVFRSTSIYGRLRRGMWHPSLLSNGLDASIKLDALVKSCLPLTSPPPIWPVVQSEKQSLHNGDVPLFKARTTSTSVADSRGQELGVVFSSSGIDVVTSRLQSLTCDDLAFQKDLIWASLQTQREDTASSDHGAGLGEHEDMVTSAHSSTGTHEHSLSAADARTGAEQIVDRLHRTTIQEGGDSVSWIVIADTDPRIQRDQVQKIGHDIHSGRSGVALFLAACNRLSERPVPGERDLTLKTVRPLLTHVENATCFPDRVRLPSIGGTYGLGSYVYALTQVGTLLDDDTLIRGAHTAASLITEKRIAEDRHFDIFFGAAGAVLGLLALYRRTGDDAVLERANQCGQHLLAHRTVEPTSTCRAWTTLNDRFMTGFSHGASGIAHALTELHRATGTRAYLDAALEAFAFERSLFLPDAKNWIPSPAHREGDLAPDALWSTWCRGATGVGLARLANLELFTDAERSDVEAAIATTHDHLLNRVDHLCCGVMGRVEFLLMAAETLDRPDLAATARNAAGAVLTRAGQAGTYTLTTSGPDRLRPGFFQGLSGIGYQLLRFIDRDALPSVLLLR